MSVLGLRASRRAIGAPLEIVLPDGRVLRVVVEGALGDGRWRVRAAIGRPGDARYLPVLALLASPDRPFFFARRGDGAGGPLIIAMRLGALTT